MKNTIIAIFAAAGSFIASFYGGWTEAITNAIEILKEKSEKNG